MISVLDLCELEKVGSDRCKAFSKSPNLPQVETRDLCFSAVTAAESYILSANSNLREVPTALYFEKVLVIGVKMSYLRKLQRDYNPALRSGGLWSAWSA